MPMRCDVVAVIVMMRRICPRLNPDAKHRTAQRKTVSLSFNSFFHIWTILNSKTRSQRAFRERKERHVKALEDKLAAFEKNTGNLTAENERLKLQLAKAATENEILKATSGHSNRGASGSLSNIGPLGYTPTDFYTEVLYAHDNKVPSHRIVTSDEGERLLAAGATWDYIIKHPLYKRGLVDVGDVSERLKKVAKCDGQGPVFEESKILDAIEKSVASGSDELL